MVLGFSDPLDTEFGCWDPPSESRRMYNLVLEFLKLITKSNIKGFFGSRYEDQGTHKDLGTVRRVVF